MRSKITMSEIARLAGVAESTVSRALNDSALVSEATKEKIRTLSEKHGYVVNATASGLRRRSTGALGLVIPVGDADANNISDPFFLEMIGAVTQAATDHDQDLIISLPSDTGSISKRRLLATGRADGLIVIGQAGRHERLNEVHDAGLPLVVWGGRLPGQRYPTVGSDNAEGGRLATEHLLSIGRRNVAFLGDRALPEVALRYQGYLKAHEERGLAANPGLYIQAPFTGFAAPAVDWAGLRQRVGVDALFAASDMLALAAIRGLEAAGLRAPQDVSVVGYDDVTLASAVSPGLTTVRQDIAAGGRKLVELMLARIEGGEAASHLTETRLVVRGTSAP